MIGTSAKKLRQNLSLILIACMLLTVLIGCTGKTSPSDSLSNSNSDDPLSEASYSESESSISEIFESSRISVSNNSVSASVAASTKSTVSKIIERNTNPLGTFLLQNPTHGSLLSSLQATVNWRESKNAETYKVVLEQLKDNSSNFVKIYEKTGLTDLKYTFPSKLISNTTYRWNAYAVNSAGELSGIGGNERNGNVFMTPIDVNNHPANKGLSFSFDGSISKNVLCNYLSRSMIVQSVATMEPDEADKVMRMIYNTGVKYIGRAGCYWNPTSSDEKNFSKVKQVISKAHKTDPNIIFEACFFECISKAVNEIAIPDWVFKAFNKAVEKRNFSYDKMIFPSGKWVNRWGTDSSVPDITQEETQMFMYYRVCSYIDLGYEGLHLGQVHLIGSDDRNWECYTKVLDMIRTYAKKNARRHFILMNAHTHGIIDNNGKLMCDFHAWPIRGAVPAGSIAHEATESNPQEIELKVGYGDAIYKKSLGGKTYSGWSCDSLPYFVELDNYSSDFPNRNKPQAWWGYDEISWYANQPKSYRAKWLKYAHNWVRDTDSVGYLEMPGIRSARVFNKNSTVGYTYYAASNLFASDGLDDEFAIRNIWVESR